MDLSSTFSLESLQLQALEDEEEQLQFLLMGLMAQEASKRLWRQRPYFPSPRRAARSYPAKKPGTICAPKDFDELLMTGLEPQVLAELYERIYPHLLRSRSLKMLGVRGFSQRPKTRFLMVCDAFSPLITKVLSWLRHMHSLDVFRATWSVSASTVCREVNFMVPILAFYLQKISPIEWPGKDNVEIVPGLEHRGVSGAIDCTTHYRVTDTYVPHLFYRGDHRACSLTTESKCTTHITLFRFVRTIRVLIASGHWTRSRGENLEGCDCLGPQL
jgi:hypothetical protein